MKINLIWRINNLGKTEWILCPVCGSKTCDRFREDTVLKNYPLYCPKCKQETLTNANELHTCFAWVLCCGAEGGILRASFGQLAFHAAQPLGGASRGGKTPHCGLFHPPFESQPSSCTTKHPCFAWVLCCGAEGGIRTHVTFPPN